MQNNERLLPARPSREELFHIAERWLERQAPKQGRTERDATPIVSNVTVPTLALGYMLAGPVSRILDERRESREMEHDQAALAAELQCRDIRPFGSIGELATHVVKHERPHTS